MNNSTTRALVISLALVAVAGVLMWEFGPANAIGIMRLRVINDMQRTVKVQSCWDPNCRHTSGLPTVILHPGDSKRLPRAEFENDITQVLTIGVLKPDAAIQEYDGCVSRVFFPHTKVAVFRVAKQTLNPVCPDIPEGGAGGG